MKIMKRILKMIGIVLGSLILIIVVATALVTNINPSFGGKVTKEQKKQFSEADNHDGKQFSYPLRAEHDMNFQKGIEHMQEEMNTSIIREPKTPLPLVPVTTADLTATPDTQTKVIWFGHSSFLVQTGGKNILIDPMFGKVASPMSFGPKRFPGKLPIEIEELPQIDALILSHDHYDHLDYESILKLKDKVQHYYLPLGNGAHFERWGIAETTITELNWWESAQLDSVEFVCLPSRHYSGRGLFDRREKLWSSWAIFSPTRKIYFSGDSGYGPHFKEIGEKYGAFDLALMECGQYNENWAQVHMMPEESAQAAVDLKADLTMPIHWGAFSLALHSWSEPVERITQKAKALNIRLVTPKIGEPIILDVEEPNSLWWKN